VQTTWVDDSMALAFVENPALKITNIATTAADFVIFLMSKV
jgi:hypothetical protein